jgi:hypothetical protein
MKRSEGAFLLRENAFRRRRRSNALAASYKFVLRESLAIIHHPSRWLIDGHSRTRVNHVHYILIATDYAGRHLAVSSLSDHFSFRVYS